MACSRLEDMFIDDEIIEIGRNGKMRRVTHQARSVFPVLERTCRNPVRSNCQKDTDVTLPPLPPPRQHRQELGRVKKNRIMDDHQPKNTGSGDANFLPEIQAQTNGSRMVNGESHTKNTRAFDGRQRPNRNSRVICPTTEHQHYQISDRDMRVKENHKQSNVRYHSQLALKSDHDLQKLPRLPQNGHTLVCTTQVQSQPDRMTNYIGPKYKNRVVYGDSHEPIIFPPERGLPNLRSTTRHEKDQSTNSTPQWLNQWSLPVIEYKERPQNNDVDLFSEHLPCLIDRSSNSRKSPRRHKKKDNPTAIESSSTEIPAVNRHKGLGETLSKNEMSLKQLEINDSHPTSRQSTPSSGKRLKKYKKMCHVETQEAARPCAQENQEERKTAYQKPIRFAYQILDVDQEEEKREIKEWMESMKRAIERAQKEDCSGEAGMPNGVITNGSFDETPEKLAMNSQKNVKGHGSPQRGKDTEPISAFQKSLPENEEKDERSNQIHTVTKSSHRNSTEQNFRTTSKIPHPPPFPRQRKNGVLGQYSSEENCQSIDKEEVHTRRRVVQMFLRWRKEKPKQETARSHEENVQRTRRKSVCEENDEFKNERMRARVYEKRFGKD